jgi:hypothetical protein
MSSLATTEAQPGDGIDAPIADLFAGLADVIQQRVHVVKDRLVEARRERNLGDLGAVVDAQHRAVFPQVRPDRQAKAAGKESGQAERARQTGPVRQLSPRHPNSGADGPVILWLGSWDSGPSGCGGKQGGAGGWDLR